MSRSIKNVWQPCGCLTEEYLPLTDVRYSGVEVVLFTKLKFIRVRVYYSEGAEGTFDTQDIVNIKYCPLCGREL